MGEAKPDARRRSRMQTAQKRKIRRLIFVYDAASGRLASMADSLKKLVGRGCPLCAVTHGVVSKRPAFERFESSVDVPIVFLHSDELASEGLSPELDLPCILAELSGSEHVVLLDSAGISRLKGSERDLEGRLQYRAASLGLELPHRARSTNSG